MFLSLDNKKLDSYNLLDQLKATIFNSQYKFVFLESLCKSSFLENPNIKFELKILLNNKTNKEKFLKTPFYLGCCVNVSFMFQNLCFKTFQPTP